MENTWRLTIVEPHMICTLDNLTYCEILEKMFEMIDYAHHGCLTRLLKCKNKRYCFEYDFSGDKVAYIFEREVENEKNTTIGRS